MTLNFYKSETYKTLQEKEKGLWKDFNAFRIKRCTMASDYVILYTHCIVERRGISQISGVEAIKAGKHVFCEKPIDHDIAKIKEVIDALEGTNLKYRLY